MIVVYFDGETWHAATSQRLIAMGHPSEASLKAAISREVGNVDIEIVDAQTWRATYLNAVGGEALVLRDIIEEMEQSTEVDKLHSRLDFLIATTEQLRAELAADRERAEAAAKRETMEREQQAQKHSQTIELEKQRGEQAIADAVADWLKDKRVENVNGVIKVWEPCLQYRHPTDPNPIRSWRLVKKVPPAVIARL
jgi:hypothetical protein